MNRLSRGIIAAAVGFCGAFVVGKASELGSDDQPRPPEVSLGRLDFLEYCRDTYGAGFTAALVAADAFGWRCAGLRNGVWGLDEIDVAAACRSQFGERSRAHTWDPDIPDSWECRST